jgi:4-oxalocrotonate tautomerase
MPYINIQVTREGVTPQQKAELIRGATDLLVRVLKKNPATTFVIIDEVDTDNWGVAGESATVIRKTESADKTALKINSEHSKK